MNPQKFIHLQIIYWNEKALVCHNSSRINAMNVELSGIEDLVKIQIRKY